ncbi:MAG: hypothetical protein SFY81_00880 [Verrucomicrobiota bacterium]|nr:hypothetical protein [Verrucomicrobiota bacterium]
MRGVLSIVLFVVFSSAVSMSFLAAGLLGMSGIKMARMIVGYSIASLFIGIFVARILKPFSIFGPLAGAWIPLGILLGLMVLGSFEKGLTAWWIFLVPIGIGMLLTIPLVWKRKPY